MAKIEEIDYDLMVTKASKISEGANAMQKDVQAAYNEMANMQSNWHGTSYDNFVKSANNAIESLNKLFKATVSDIPHEIAAKAKSYAASNQGELGVNYTEQTVISLSELSKTNKGSKFRFRSDDVSSNQRNIKSRFGSAKSYADYAKRIAESLQDDWKSVSGDNNIRELKSCFKRVKKILDDLETALNNQINAQIATINAIETANNTVEKVQDVVEDAVDSATQAANSATETIKQAATDVWTNLTM